MIRTDAIVLTLAFLAGLALGAAFFAGLWWTVRRATGSRRPALWFLAGFAARMAMALGGFYVVGHGDAARLVACLAGFIAARIAIVAWTRRSCKPAQPSPPAKEVSDAP